MNATSPSTQTLTHLHLHIVVACAFAAIATGYLAESSCAVSGSSTSQSEVSGSRFQVSEASSSAAMSSSVRSHTLLAQQASDTTAAVPTDQPLESQYYQEYQSVVVPTQPSTATPPQIAPPPPPQIPLPPPLPQPAPPPPNQSTPLPPINQPASLNEPIWVMPGTAPPASTQPVKVPGIQPWTPPPVSRPAAPVQPPGSPELAVQATDVQLVGVEPELQQYGLRAIQTKPGGQTSPSQLQNDVAALLNTGFFATATVTTRSNPQGVSVTFLTTPMIVRSLQLPNARALSVSVANTFFQDQFGKPINPSALNQAVKQINEWYAKNGYTLARVLNLQPRREGVITIEVAEGTIRDVKIRFVNRQGKAIDDKGQPIRYRTQESFVRRQIKLEPGQVFQVNRAQEDLQRLNQLGIFELTNVTFEGDARQVDVIYNLAERPPRDLRFGGGYNDTLGLYGTVGIQDINFGGLGQQLGGTVLVGTRDVQFDARFVSPYRATEPNVPGYNANLYRQQGSSLVFDDDIELTNGDRVRERRLGAGVGIEQPLGSNWNGILSVNYANVSLRDGDGDVFSTDERGNPLSLSGTGIDDLFSVSFTAINDLRDNPINPSTGSITSISTEQFVPIGRGQVFGTRVQAAYSQYIPINLITKDRNEPLGDRQPEVLAFNVQGGTVVGDLPPYNAFVLGGPNSVRGYDTGDVATSRSYIQASAEYRFPIYKFIGGAAFFDFASDLSTSGDVLGEPGVQRGKPGTGFGFGVGLRINSPFGILRGDFGISNKGDTRFQFGFGQRF